MGILDGLLDNLAKKYGAPPPWLRQEVERYILDELAHETPEERETIYRAIGRACRMVDGFPDVAAIRSAVWQWAQAGLGDLERRPRSAREWDPESLPADPVGARAEHVRDYERIARAKGIDTTREGWMVALLMREIRERAV